MERVALVLIGLPAVLFAYAYAGYPALLWLASRFRPSSRETEETPSQEHEWPSVSVCLPAYNEERTIEGALEALLALEYPRDRMQILVVSDASTDRTDEIVASYAARGVELLRVPRGGKTAAENAALPHLRGEVIVNTDASIRIPPASLKPLLHAFRDPGVGVASGRDVSVPSASTEANVAERGYVGYEMWLRGLETHLGGIVGASGCFYAIRAALHGRPLPRHLSRDFASALVAHEHGYRAVSVEDAVCYVPRTVGLRTELRRKVRTMARGLDTLWYKRVLLDPFRHGAFAWKLFSHKLCRWLVPLTLPVGLLGLAVLGAGSAVGLWLLGGAALVTAAGAVALAWPADRPLPRPLATLGYVLVANAAGMGAWLHLARGRRSPVWEPTRRGSVRPPPRPRSSN